MTGRWGWEAKVLFSLALTILNFAINLIWWSLHETQRAFCSCGIACDKIPTLLLFKSKSKVGASETRA